MGVVVSRPMAKPSKQRQGIGQTDPASDNGDECARHDKQNDAVNLLHPTLRPSLASLSVGTQAVLFGIRVKTDMLIASDRERCSHRCHETPRINSRGSTPQQVRLLAKRRFPCHPDFRYRPNDTVRIGDAVTCARAACRNVDDPQEREEGYTIMQRVTQGILLALALLLTVSAVAAASPARHENWTMP